MVKLKSYFLSNVKNFPLFWLRGVCVYTYKIYMSEFNLVQYRLRASLLAQLVKNLSAIQETWVQSLGQEDPLEKEMATHSSIPAWEVL